MNSVIKHRFSTTPPDNLDVKVGELVLQINIEDNEAKLYTKGYDDVVIELGKGVSKLSDIQDVDLTNVTEGSFFIKSGDKFVASNFIASISSIADIEINNSIAGQYLRYNPISESYENYSVTYSIYDLLNVDLANPNNEGELQSQDNKIIYYDYATNKFKTKPRVNLLEELLDVELTSDPPAYEILTKDTDNIWRNLEVKIERDSSPKLQNSLNSNGYQIQNSSYRVNKLLANQPIIDLNYAEGDYWIIEGVSSAINNNCLINIIAEPRDDSSSLLLMLEIRQDTGLITLGGFSNAYYEDGYPISLSGVGKTDLITLLCFRGVPNELRRLNIAYSIEANRTEIISLNNFLTYLSSFNVTFNTWKDFILNVKNNNRHLHTSCPDWLKAYITSLNSLETAGQDIENSISINEVNKEARYKFIPPFTYPLNNEAWLEDFNPTEFNTTYISFLGSVINKGIYPEETELEIGYTKLEDRLTCYITSSALNIAKLGQGGSEAYRYDKNRYPATQTFNVPSLYDDYFKYVQLLLNFEPRVLTNKQWYEDKSLLNNEVETNALKTDIDTYTYGLQESVAKFINNTSNIEITFSNTIVLDNDFTFEFYVNYENNSSYYSNNLIEHEYFTNQDNTFSLKYVGQITDTIQNTELILKLGTDIYKFNNAFRYFQYQNNRYIHIAIVRSGTIITLYVDGIKQNAYSFPSTFVLNIISLITADIKLIGNLNSVRLTKYARYLNNFIIPNMRYGLLGGKEGILEDIINSSKDIIAEQKDCIAWEIFSL